MDLCLCGKNRNMTPAEVAPLVDLTPEQVENIYRNIGAKLEATRYLHAVPAVLDGTCPAG